MFRKAIPLLTLLLLVGPTFGRLVPACPIPFASAQAVPTASRVSALQVTGPFTCGSSSPACSWTWPPVAPDRTTLIQDAKTPK